MKNYGKGSSSLHTAYCATFVNLWSMELCPATNGVCCLWQDCPHWAIQSLLLASFTNLCQSGLGSMNVNPYCALGIGVARLQTKDRISVVPSKRLLSPANLLSALQRCVLCTHAACITNRAKLMQFAPQSRLQGTLMRQIGPSHVLTIRLNNSLASVWKSASTCGTKCRKHFLFEKGFPHPLSSRLGQAKPRAYPEVGAANQSEGPAPEMDVVSPCPKKFNMCFQE